MTGPEDGRPAQRGGSRRLGGQPVQHGLDVAEVRPLTVPQVERPVRRARAVVGPGPVTGPQHRQPVPPRTRHRDADEHVVHRTAGVQVYGPHAVAGGHVPVDLDVGDQETLGQDVALEGQPGRLADQAVRPVAAHHIAGGQPLGAAVGAREDDLHLVRVRRDRADLDRPLHLRAEACEMLGEQPLGRVLGQRGEGVRDVRRQRQPDRSVARLAVGEDQLAQMRHRLVQHPGDQAHAVPHLQRAGQDADGLRVRLRGGQAVDDAAVHSVPPQLGRRRQSHRARAHHEYVDIGHDPALSSSDRGFRASLRRWTAGDAAGTGPLAARGRQTGWSGRVHQAPGSLDRPGPDWSSAARRRPVVQPAARGGDGVSAPFGAVLHSLAPLLGDSVPEGMMVCCPDSSDTCFRTSRSSTWSSGASATRRS